jgi:hypothetical protein
LHVKQAVEQPNGLRQLVRLAGREPKGDRTSETVCDHASLGAIARRRRFVYGQRLPLLKVAHRSASGTDILRQLLHLAIPVPLPNLGRPASGEVAFLHVRIRSAGHRQHASISTRLYSIRELTCGRPKFVCGALYGKSGCSPHSQQDSRSPQRRSDRPHRHAFRVLGARAGLLTLATSKNRDGAAAVTFVCTFFGFFASRLLRCCPFDI